MPLLVKAATIWYSTIEISSNTGHKNIRRPAQRTHPSTMISFTISCMISGCNMFGLFVRRYDTTNDIIGNQWNHTQPWNTLWFGVWTVCFHEVLRVIIIDTGMNSDFQYSLEWFQIFLEICTLPSYIISQFYDIVVHWYNVWYHNETKKLHQIWYCCHCRLIAAARINCRVSQDQTMLMLLNLLPQHLTLWGPCWR